MGKEKYMIKQYKEAFNCLMMLMIKCLMMANCHLKLLYKFTCKLHVLMVQYHQDYLQTREDKPSRSAHSMGDKGSVWWLIPSDLSCEIPMSLQSLEGLTPEVPFKVSSLPEKETLKICMICPRKAVWSKLDWGPRPQLRLRDVL